MPTLFDPIALGAFQLPNRILMSPMTRGRADTATAVPTPMMINYYARRADAGLIITEATGISRQGLGWHGAPGLWTEAQVAGWQPITAAVHKNGGRIVAQLWHMGRASHSDFNDGAQPVAASAIAIKGHTYTPLGKKEYEVPRALETNEIAGIVADYAHAAANAKLAGFDGVEVHGANGYLLDNFLKNANNKRTDQYGGSAENRTRFLAEATAAVVNVWGADRVGVRISPLNKFNDAADSDPQALYEVVAKTLSPFNLAFLDVLETLPGHFMYTEGEPVHPAIRQHYKGPMVLNGGYLLDEGSAALASGAADAIAIGVPYLSNPDLVSRLKNGWPLAAPSDPSTWYMGGTAGYDDHAVYGK